MAVKKRGLGRGLDALLGGASVKVLQEQAAATPVSELQSLPVDIIQRGKYQPRRHMDPTALEELANSIRVQGLMQPIVVRAIGEGRYEIIAGERRWRASQQAGLDRIPALVRDVPDQVAIALALIENIQRQNLNPLEEAMALQRLQDEFELTQAQVAEAVGKSRSGVTNLLRLLALAEEAKDLLARGELEWAMPAPCSACPRPARPKGRGTLSHGASPSARPRPWCASGSAVRSRWRRPPAVDPDISRLEQRLAERLGANVQIRHGEKGKGQLVIRYSSLDELQGVLAHIPDTNAFRQERQSVRGGLNHSWRAPILLPAFCRHKACQ